MANKNVRVVIPKNAEEVLDLGNKVYQKHVDLAANSPLNSLVAHRWEDNGPKIVRCQALHNQAEDLKREAEKIYRQRDVMLAEITESIKASRDLLLGVYRDAPKELGRYGFEVNDTKSTTTPPQA